MLNPDFGPAADATSGGSDSGGKTSIGTGETGDPLPSGPSTDDRSTTDDPTSPHGTTEEPATSTTDDVGPAVCCNVTDVPGCGEPALEECVCEADPSCCDQTWHRGCVEVAVLECGQRCEPGNCCVPSLGTGCEDPAISNDVCTERPVCCEAWTQECADLAVTSHGACAGQNPCCNATNETVGCSDPNVLACTCAADPFCCTQSYDPVCVAVAHSCGGNCLAGMPACCDATAPAGPQPGCHAPLITECVCGMADAAGCCEGSWTADCAEVAMVCGGCEDCCATHPGPGCAIPEIALCVCDVDSTCCALEWHQGCVDIASRQCGFDC